MRWGSHAARSITHSEGLIHHENYPRSCSAGWLYHHIFKIKAITWERIFCATLLFGP